MDVTGEEFEMLMELLGQLSCLSTPKGSQQLSSLIGEQAELSADFKVFNTTLSGKEDGIVVTLHSFPLKLLEYVYQFLQATHM